MLRVGVLVSGGGTNLQAVIDNVKSGYLDKVEICLVLSSNDMAYALERAKKNNIPTCVLNKKKYKNQEIYESELFDVLNKYKVELVVLAGFMIVLGKEFVNKFKNRMINVHPSLIPSFCGKGFYGITPHREALCYGVKVSGATVHFVDANTDTGPIILQKAIDIEGIKDEQVLQRKIMEECEWQILPEAIKYISEDMIQIDGRRVDIKREEVKK